VSHLVAAVPSISLHERRSKVMKLLKLSEMAQIDKIRHQIYSARHPFLTKNYFSS
jgi:hypothetical protein